ncbi:precorrin-3B synthase [Streptomyces sp. NPDC058045]|uniref:precorrin-3B synthase n=1 Tax=Streptomyces sp. NPDC058045 TaxID=3346311 RepID=UPI0036ED3E66
MPPTSANTPDRDKASRVPQDPGAPRATGPAAPVRDRGDACPGALRLHPADDGPLARLRLPGGLLTAFQARALGDAARHLADGRIGITSRGNAELRALDAEGTGELAALLTTAGLLPSPAHDRIRNILASPLSGLDGRGHTDVRPWVRELDHLLCSREWTTGLSGRFLFALDDGRGDTAALGADVTLLALPDGTAALRLGGQDPADEVWFVTAEDGPRAALAAAEAFLTTAATTGGGAWRMSELPATARPDIPAALHRAGLRPLPPGRAPTPAGEPPPPGLLTGPGGRRVLSVHAPLGRLTADQWDLLRPPPGGELRLTPWRGAVLSGLDAGPAAERLTALAAAGLITSADSPWHRVTACTGRPGCARSRTDVRADAEHAVRAGPRAALPVHWSGCERRCGRPRGEHLDIVATPDGYRTATRGTG